MLRIQFQLRRGVARVKILFTLLMFTWAFLLVSAAIRIFDGDGLGPIALLIVACVGMGLTITLRVKGRL
jgi:hypothetical protein